MSDEKTRGAQITIRKVGTLVSATLVGDLDGASVNLGLDLMKAKLIAMAAAGVPAGSGRPLWIEARRADVPAEG